jgi:hypothetical protein
MARKHNSGRRALRGLVQEKIRLIYAGDEQSAENEATMLLANVLREGDVNALSALRQFFDVPSTEEANDDIDGLLISRVRMFANGQNWRHVESWLSFYERSRPDSWHRRVAEETLRNFVESRSVIEAAKCGLAELDTLRSEVLEKWTAVRGLIQAISKSARKDEPQSA